MSSHPPPNGTGKCIHLNIRVPYLDLRVMLELVKGLNHCIAWSLYGVGRHLDRQRVHPLELCGRARKVWINLLHISNCCNSWILSHLSYFDESWWASYLRCASRRDKASAKNAHKTHTFPRNKTKLTSEVRERLNTNNCYINSQLCTTD